MNGKQLFLKPDEAKFLGMAVVDTLETIQATASNPNIPWDPKSRKDLREMIEAGQRLRDKLKKLGFDVRPLPDYIEGEETDYFTKES